MKFLLFLSIVTISSLASAAQDWKVIAETTSCDEKIQILAKEGEKYVLAVKGNEKTKLFAKDGSAYTEKSLKMTEYASDPSSEVKYNFMNPAYVEASLPKIDVGPENKSKRCKMALSR